MIIVVDDDPRVRQATVKSLVVSGCAVQGFETGRLALDFIARCEIAALLITDVLMPEMSGPELASAVKRLKPALPIIFMSGDIGVTPLSAFKGHTLLAKPFTASALLSAVDAALTSR
jgi:FixJ family two-component response regulator